jgi:hypothetical protein
LDIYYNILMMPHGPMNVKNNKRYSAVQMKDVKFSVNVGHASLFEIFVYTTFTKIVLLLHVYRGLS